MKNILRPFVLALAMASPLFAQTTAGVQFDHRFLIAVHRPGSAAIEKALVPPGGWRIEPLFGAGDARGSSTLPGDDRVWLVVSREASSRGVAALNGRTAWDQAHQLVDGRDLELAAYLRTLGDAVEVEPNVIMPRAAKGAKAQPLRCTAAPAGYISLCSQPSRHWPAPKGFGWHLGDDYSQLKRARDAAMASFRDGSEVVTVLHLDTGYNPAAGNAFGPEKLDVAASRSFVGGETGAEDRYVTGFNAFPGHGTGTLSVLAGGHIRVSDPSAGEFDDYYGGAPLAHVIEYRVANTVAQIWPVDMVRALHSAWAVDHADVISMAMGSSPSAALRDEVNQAYEHGTAMFFASGDFLQTPFGIRTPHTTVYPARFSRTVAVAGVTGSLRSYGLNPGWWSLLHGQWSGWMARGSWGPAGVMAHTIVAFTPNVARNRMTPEKTANLADLDFAGTSAATPQVAAAAALWLQTHRGSFDAESWRSWRKAQAVYDVLFASAQRPGEGSGREKYWKAYYGHGILKAADALAMPVPATLEKAPPAAIGLDWLSVIGAILPKKDDATSKEPHAELHTSMLRTEIEQLLQSNRAMEEAAEKLDTARFLTALLRDPRASDFLKAHVIRPRVKVHVRVMVHR